MQDSLHQTVVRLIWRRFARFGMPTFDDGLSQLPEIAIETMAVPSISFGKCRFQPIDMILNVVLLHNSSCWTQAPTRIGKNSGRKFYLIVKFNIFSQIPPFKKMGSVSVLFRVLTGQAFYEYNRPHRITEVNAKKST
ncbi:MULTISPECIES: hypothetical protein [Desulfococcus]|uniref:hypothetical protein n=1 Tax=Desulfococcus TaxID=896 RepID=UPI0013562F7B|nr:hypothetical protein [Desulfococcus multivorans]MDX9818019.1 hypothetical protein [Desulfococcus multivorans]